MDRDCFQLEQGIALAIRESSLSVSKAVGGLAIDTQFSAGG
jgi:hypothetical protein